jgi:hypothetical protein
MINLSALFTANSELTVLFFVNSDLFIGNPDLFTVNSERSEKSQEDSSLRSAGFFDLLRGILLKNLVSWTPCALSTY